MFVRCDFRGLMFDQRLQPLFTSPVQTVFRDCGFDGADLRKAGPGQSRFESCSFDGAKIDRWNSHAAEFIDCRFTGRIESAKFYGKPPGAAAAQLDPPRTSNEFVGNDFRDAVLADTLFVHGIPFAKQKWPEGPDHVRFDRIHQRLQRARAEVMRWTDIEKRTAALEMILRLSTRYGEQPELVRVRYDGSSTPVAIQDQVWELIARPIGSG